MWVPTGFSKPLEVADGKEKSKEKSLKKKKEVRTSQALFITK